MYYPKSDIYPGMSDVPTVSENTVPEETVQNTDNSTTTQANGNLKVQVNTKMIWGAMVLLVGVMLALHFMGGGE